jgi:hypothetical protein
LPTGDFDRRAETLLGFHAVRRLLRQQTVHLAMMQTGELLAGLRDGSKCLETG